MLIDATSAAISGLRAAGVRLGSAAHNVSNLLTEDFRPERVVQSAEPTAGVSAHAERAPAPAEIDLAAEFVDQDLAALQGRASLRVLDVQLDLLGSLLDLHR